MGQCPRHGVMGQCDGAVSSSWRDGAVSSSWRAGRGTLSELSRWLRHSFALSANGGEAESE